MYFNDYIHKKCLVCACPRKVLTRLENMEDSRNGAKNYGMYALDIKQLK